MKYIKAKWEELKLGKKFYFELMIEHKVFYKQVIIIDLTDKKVVYKYEDNWKEYQTKGNFREVGLYKEDKQVYLF